MGLDFLLMDGEGWMCLADGRVLLKLIRQYLANDGHKVDRCLDACYQYCLSLECLYLHYLARSLVASPIN